MYSFVFSFFHPTLFVSFINVVVCRCSSFILNVRILLNEYTTNYLVIKLSMDIWVIFNDDLLQIVLTWTSYYMPFGKYVCVYVLGTYIKSVTVGPKGIFLRLNFSIDFQFSQVLALIHSLTAVCENSNCISISTQHLPFCIFFFKKFNVFEILIGGSIVNICKPFLTNCLTLKKIIFKKSQNL